MGIYYCGVSLEKVIMMTLDEILQEIHAMRQNLLVFERKYGVPSELFFEAYQNGEEPADSAWVLDWAEWAATYKVLQRRLVQYQRHAHQLVKNSTVANLAQLIERTVRHESFPIAA